MENWEHRTATYILGRLAYQAKRMCGPLTKMQAMKLVKRAMSSDSVRAAILEHVEEALVDEATAKIWDTKAPRKTRNNFEL